MKPDAPSTPFEDEPGVAAFENYQRVRATAEMQIGLTDVDTDVDFLPMFNAAEAMLTTPVRLPWLVKEKFDLFEREVFPPDNGRIYLDARELIWFASLKADAICLAIELERLKLASKDDDTSPPNIRDLRIADDLSEIRNSLALVREMAEGWCSSNNSGLEKDTANGLTSLLSEQIERIIRVRNRIIPN